MPRSSVLLTAAPVDAAVVALAAGQVHGVLVADNPGLPEFELLAVDEGAALQVRGGDGDLLATVMRPRLLPRDDEVSRLLPGQVDALAAGSVWTEAVMPWGATGMVGTMIVQRIADNLNGIAVHGKDRAGESFTA